MLRFLTRTLLGGPIMYFSGLLLWSGYHTIEKRLPRQFIDNQLASEFPRDEVIVWADISGALVLAALLTMLIGWRGCASAGDGLKTGAVVGLMVWVGVDLTLYANFELVTVAALLTDPLIESAKFAAAGAAIALVGREPEL